MKNKFNECLQEANKKLCNKYFTPELDDLSDGTIDDILYVVLLEYDLLEEGNLEDMGGFKVPTKSANSWKKKVELFIKKWKNDIENKDELSMYSRFE